MSKSLSIFIGVIVGIVIMAIFGLISSTMEGSALGETIGIAGIAFAIIGGIKTNKAIQNHNKETK